MTIFIDYPFLAFQIVSTTPLPKYSIFPQMPSLIDLIYTNVKLEYLFQGSGSLDYKIADLTGLAQEELPPLSGESLAV